MMYTNTDLKTIGETLQAADSVLLFPHDHPDADAIGSCVALCMIMRNMGKESWVILEEKLKTDLSFLDRGYCSWDPNILKDPQVTVAVDCSDADRFGKVAHIFEAGARKIALDHHRISHCSQDLYYVDPASASATEIVYELIMTMGWEMDTACAQALYTGIVTDTGSFQHSNTTPKTHRIAADLIEAGADVNYVTTVLYKNIDPRTVALEADVFGRIEIFASGMAAMVSISREDLKRCGAGPEHADHMIDNLIRIRGVEIAATLKERGSDVGLSLRSKSWGDVEAIARSLGGGGHIKAAGCTMKMPIQEAYELVHSKIEEALKTGERP